MAGRGEPEGAAVLAGVQSNGRGTNGRRWQSDKGNLFLSVLLRPPDAAREGGQYSLLGGVALLEALGRFLPPREELFLRWPNDVLLGARKVAGILVESAAQSDGGIAWLVIGFGANLAIRPSISGEDPASLADTGIIPPSPIDAARALLTRLRYWLDTRAKEGLAPIRGAWLGHTYPLGTPMTIADASGSHRGGFAGIDPSGALLLETRSETRRYIAGRVRMNAEAVACSL